MVDMLLKKRGRPRLTEEEKLRRIQLKESLPLKKRGRPRKEITQSIQSDNEDKVEVKNEDKVEVKTIPEEVLRDLIEDSTNEVEQSSDAEPIITEKVRNTSIRSFVFTRHILTHIPIEELTSEMVLEEYAKMELNIMKFKNVSYYVFKFELGKSKKSPHLQGFVDLNKPLKFRTITNMLPNTHIEKRRGSKEQAIKYVKKDDVEVLGNFPECIVVEPFPFKPSKQGRRTDLTMMQADFATNYRSSLKELYTYHGKMMLQHGRAILDMRSVFGPSRQDKTRVTLVYGPAQSGKTTWARNSYPNAFYKTAETGKWFDGYDPFNKDHEIVIIDEYDLLIKEQGIGFLLKLMDHGPCQVEVKGHTLNFTAKMLILISQISIFEIINRVRANRTFLKGHIDFYLDNMSFYSRMYSFINRIDTYYYHIGSDYTAEQTARVSAHAIIIANRISDFKNKRQDLEYETDYTDEEQKLVDDMVNAYRTVNKPSEDIVDERNIWYLDMENLVALLLSELSIEKLSSLCSYHLWINETDYLIITKASNYIMCITYERYHRYLIKSCGNSYVVNYDSNDKCYIIECNLLE